MSCSDQIITNLKKFPLSKKFSKKLSNDLIQEKTKIEKKIILYEKTFKKAISIVHTKRALF